MNDTPKTPRRDDPLNAGRKEGERRKDHAHQILEARRKRLILLARRVLLMVALQRGWVTADDVRAGVTVPDGIDPRCLGPVPGTLAREGILRGDGSAKSCRPTAHARKGLTVWWLVNRDAAERWLAEHPPPPDDTGPVAGATEPALDFSI